MAKSTRFVTTVSARNLLHSNGFEGYYLDGRISGPRDSRMGETTLDREERGFFYAIYTNFGSDIKETAFNNKKYLDKIFEDIKSDNRYNIDNEINELADCAVKIGGRPVLDVQVKPYFAGLIVKDGEMAAITSGKGLAYLYRNDILYPLTDDEFPIAEHDLNGNKVPNIDLYCAGVAGTIRYSNIAQLQPDDCFILTNLEVMETIGHMEMLRILEESYDQQDAAGRVFDIMAERNPEASMQFMIGLVDSLTTLDKAALRSMTSRMGWTQKTLNNMGGLSTLAEMETAPTVHNTYGAPAAEPMAASEVSTYETLNKPNYASTYAHAPQAQASVQQVPLQQDTTRFETAALPKEAPMQRRETLTQATSQVPVVGYGTQRKSRVTERAKVEETEPEGLTLAQKILVGFLLSMILILASSIAYMYFFGLPSFLQPSTTESSQPETSLPESTRPPIVIETTRPPETSLPESSEETSSSVPESSSSSSSTSTSTSSSSSTSTSTSSSSTTRKHTVQAGDTLWGIAAKYAAGRDIDAYIQELINANPVVLPDGTQSTLLPGEEVNIP